MGEYTGMEFGVHLFMKCDDTGLQTCIKIEGAKVPPAAPRRQYRQALDQAKGLMGNVGASSPRPMTNEEIETYKAEQED